MSKLDDIITQKAYELNCLQAYRDIVESGDCNTCKFLRDCDIRPRVGELVRYNCYRYEERK